MNIIIYTVAILTIFYFLLKVFSNISSKKISKGLRFLIIIGLLILAILFAIGGRFLLTLPLTLASLALLKLKGLSKVAFSSSFIENLDVILVGIKVYSNKFSEFNFLG